MGIRKRKVFYVLAIVTFLVASGIYYYQVNNKSRDGISVRTEEEAQVSDVKTKPKQKKTVVKASVILSVPYTVQAPLVNWAVHEESCEEAAVLMYHYFLSGKETFSGSTIIPAYVANSEMIKMKHWQVSHYGREPDLSIEKLGVFVSQYYGYHPRVFKGITIQDIKRELSAGHPVLVPVMTHALKNPHYGPKSVYHILLIKGYNSKGAITNDAGIKEGQSAAYPWSTVFSAIDQQTQKMGQGRVMLILTK